MKHVFRKAFLMPKTLVLTLLLLSAIVHIYAQPDTIYAIGQIIPYDISSTNSLNFPLKLAEPIGDINGDGLCDFTVNTWALNEKTEDPNDFVQKSAIITDITEPQSAYVFHSAELKGIGDYNGDGFEDMVDLTGHKILLGRQSGHDFTTIDFEIPDEMDYVHFRKDLTGDGKADFILGGQYIDSLFLFSQEFDSCKALSLYGMWPTIDDIFIDFYDYDNDGINELLVSTYSLDRFVFRWFVYDSIAANFQLEKQKSILPTQEPSVHFSNSIADMNGDGLMDICYSYFENGGMNLAVMFGSNTSTNYFTDPVEFEIGNKNRLIYCAGDFNNDGTDDWYSKVAVDTVIIYYSSDSVATHGFNTALFAIDTAKLVMPYAWHSITISPLKNLKTFDYNGDSISDILMSYWSFNESKHYDTTGMIIYLGNNNPDLNEKLVFGDTEPFKYSGEGFGIKISNAGDFNQDGFEDWAILAEHGKYINIYFGGTVLDYQSDMQVLLPQMPDSQCFDMVFGDLNNDGWIDLAVSNGNFNSTIRMVSSLIDAVEEVYIFYGGPDMPDVVDWRDAEIILDGYAGDYTSYGRSLAIPGDYNNDGYNDLLAGGGQSYNGTKGVDLYFGGNQFANNPSITIGSSIGYGNYYFGYPITSCGDIDDNGYRDFTLGAGSLQGDKGKSLVYFGSYFYDSIQDMVLDNPTAGGRSFGTFTPRNEGDFNNDGVPDLAHYDPYNDEATIYIYKGGKNMDNTIDLFLSDAERLNQLRYIEYVPDFTEKNKSDIVIMSAYNDPNLFLFTGSDHDKTEVDYIFKNNLRNASSVASGDFNNDGHTDLLVGNSNSAAAGWIPCGVVQHYTSPIMVGTNNESIENSTTLTIAPNPTKDNIEVIYNSSVNEEITITIYTLTGSEVYKTHGESNKSNTINLTRFKSGVYIVNILSGGKAERMKIVKV